MSATTEDGISKPDSEAAWFRAFLLLAFARVLWNFTEASLWNVLAYISFALGACAFVVACFASVRTRHFSVWVGGVTILCLVLCLNYIFGIVN